MTALTFSIPMVAEMNDDSPVVQAFLTQYPANVITKMIASIITESPEFREAMDILNDGASWLVADVDYDALNV